MSSNSYHIPVLLHAAVQGLAIRPGATYVDVTFGGGGHSREILTHLPEGRLFGFDQDPAAQKNAPTHDSFVFVTSNFRYITEALAAHGVSQIDGLLADLGVSSRQFDDADRGFSIRFDARLDMRMDTHQELSAFEVINTYEEALLKRIFREYGEVEQAGRLTAAIARRRRENPIQTTGELLELIASVAPRAKEKQYQAKVFQAIRIEVNAELDALRELLLQCTGLIRPGGRLVFISYHSLEDRLVKNFMRTGNLLGQLEKDFYGNPIRPFTEVTRKPIVPTTAETEENPRARSAKLRIAERIDESFQAHTEKSRG